MSRSLGMFASGGVAVFVVMFIVNTSAGPPPQATLVTSVVPNLVAGTIEQVPTFELTKLNAARATAPDQFASVTTLRSGPIEVATALERKVGEEYESQVFVIPSVDADANEWVDLGALSCVVTALDSGNGESSIDCGVNAAPEGAPSAFTVTRSTSEDALDLDGLMVSSFGNGGRTVFNTQSIKLGDEWSVTNPDGKGERSFKFTGYAKVGGQPCITVVEESTTEQELIIPDEVGGGERIRFQNHIEATHYFDYTNHRLLRSEQSVHRSNYVAGPMTTLIVDADVAACDIEIAMLAQFGDILILTNAL